MRKVILIVAAVALVFSLFSCATTELGQMLGPKTRSEIIFEGPDGYTYLLEAKIGGVNAKVEDGKVVAAVPDGEYTVVLKNVNVFEKEYTVTIKNGKGVVKLKKVSVPAYDILDTTKEKVFVLANFGGYIAAEVVFDGSGSSAAGTFDGYIWVRNHNKAAVVPMKKEAKLGDWIVIGADDNWKEPVKFIGYDEGKNPHEISL